MLLFLTTIETAIYELVPVFFLMVDALSGPPGLLSHLAGLGRRIKTRQASKNVGLDAFFCARVLRGTG